MSKLTTSSDIGAFLASANKQAAVTSLGLRDILTVLTAADRKNVGTYTGATSASVGYTRVFQSDLPGILWTLIDTDVTLDASWIGQPYTVDPDGDVIVSMELADITGTVPDRNVLGVSGNQLRLGDGMTTDGVDVFPSAARVMSLIGDRLIASLATVRASNAGTCHFATTRATSFTFSVKTSTGYARIVNPDNTLGAQVGSGVAENSIAISSPASGLHRAYGVISVVNGGSARSGNITYLSLNTALLTSFSGTGLSALTELYLPYNQLTSFSGTGLTALTKLVLNNNQLISFSGTSLTALTYLELSDNQLISFSDTGLSALTYLELSYNQLISFTGTSLSALTELYLSNNQLTSFSGTGLSALTYLELGGNQLTSFSGTGLTALTSLFLYINQLTSFSSTGLTALTLLQLSDNQLTSFSGTGLSALTDLYLENNQLTSFSGTGLSALTYLQLRNNQLISFSSTGLSALINLYLGDNQLTSFSGTGFTALTALGLDDNQLISFSGTGLAALTYLNLSNNQLTSFSGTGLAALATFLIFNNQLTSILATGLNLSYNSSNTYGSTIRDNDLSLEALQAFVDSLAVTTTGLIQYGGNPGSTAFAAWLTPANDKDYIWLNT